MENKNSLITIFIFSICILTLTVVDILTPDRLFSKNENRLLAKKPEWRSENFWDGSYGRDYENYLTDQFTGRDKWMKFKTVMEISMGNKEINGVYLAKDGTLIEQHLLREINEKEAENKLFCLSKLLSPYQKQLGSSRVKVMLVPTADEIRKEVLPDFAEDYNQSVFLNKAKEIIGTEYVVDLRETFCQNKNEDIYYGTDHHWTTKGAYLAYVQWMGETGREAEEEKQYEKEVVSSSFLGTLHSKVNIRIKPDKIILYHPKKRINCRIRYDLSEEFETDPYHREHLSGKNQYAVFFNDNHALVEIETDNKNGRQLFIFKDSYANSFTPFVISDYEKIYMLDLRYFQGNIEKLMDEKKPSDILVLYNIIHFINDFPLSDW